MPERRPEPLEGRGGSPSSSGQRARHRTRPGGREPGDDNRASRSLPHATYVDIQRELDAAVEALRDADAVSFDTEFVGEGHYQPQLCLAQIATDRGVWIIDPLSGIDLIEFWEVLTEREVVALAAREEVRFCLRYAGRPPISVFDPQIAAGLVGFGYPLSHTNLVHKVLGARVEGGESFTDWRRRPLTEKQLEYAGDDVRHLLAARRRLMDKAEQLGRADWLNSECTRAVERILAGEQEERWWRVSGSTRLRPRELAVLRELWHWREETAQATDQPPRRVLTDDLLIEIAKRKPETSEDLFQLRGLERSSVRRAGREIVAAVQEGLRLPDSDLPHHQRRDDPPQLGVLAQIVSVLAKGLAEEHQVDTALLGTTSDLQDLVRWHLSGEQGELPLVLEGWRGEILGRPLLDLLSGRSAMRVANSQSPNPLRVEPLPGRL